MSNHSTQKRIDLHHRQINNAITRRTKRQNDSLLAFLERRAIVWERGMAWRLSVFTIYNLCWYVIMVAIILAEGWLVV